MLPQKEKDELQRLGFDIEKLESAIKDEKEVSLTIPTLKTEDDFSKLISPDDKELFGKNRFDEGKKAMSEIKAKEYKEKFKIEIDGKNLDEVVEAYATKKSTEAGKKPEEWATEKTELQKKIIEAEEKLSSKEVEFKEKVSIIENRNQVRSLITAKTNIPKQDLVDLFSLRYRVAEEDGRTVVYKGSEKLKDSRLEPLSLKDVVSSFLEEGKYLKVDGMGGGNGNGGGGGSAKFKSLIEFEDHCKSQKINPMSEEGQKILKERRDETVSDENFYVVPSDQ